MKPFDQAEEAEMKRRSRTDSTSKRSGRNSGFSMQGANQSTGKPSLQLSAKVPSPPHPSLYFVEHVDQSISLDEKCCQLKMPQG